MKSADWQPSCSIQMFRIRAEMLRAIRMFFRHRDYLEVETPCLSRDVVLDAWLEPFTLDAGGDRWFLQTSPEAHMKRLLAAGVGSMFQISHVFRKNESGERHNCEFTMVEWYGVESTWLDQLVITESLIRTATAAAARVTGSDVASQWSREAFKRTTYAAAFQRTFGVDIFDCSGARLIAIAQSHGVPLPPDLCEENFDDILNVMLAIEIEPRLGAKDEEENVHPEFLHDYPPSQAALALVSDKVPNKVARRFELYVQGLELCNGYQELSDAAELERRDTVQNLRRSQSRSAELPGAPRLMAAMQSGLPACSGVALGFDRLVMVATSHSNIRDVMPFPGEMA